MKTPVAVLRLPRGPDPDGRGFEPSSPRFRALRSGGDAAPPPELRGEQQARSLLRQRYLRSLLAMRDAHVRFRMYERVRVEARFGACDVDVLNFQVSDLQTPIGVQKEALLRCPDTISYSFEL